MRIEFPWPDSALIPHAKGHWRGKAAATKKYRHQCHMISLGYFSTHGNPDTLDGADINMVVTFSPPDRRRRDRMNIEASFKAGFDGIADALGVDDYRFCPRYRHREPVKGGLVVVEFEPPTIADIARKHGAR